MASPDRCLFHIDQPRDADARRRLIRSEGAGLVTRVRLKMAEEDMYHTDDPAEQRELRYEIKGRRSVLKLIEEVRHGFYEENFGR